MKLILLLLTITVTTCSCADGDLYTNRYDKINLDEILENKRLLVGYMKCVLSKGPCTPEGKELKYYILDALKSGCNKCTDFHRINIKKVIKYLVKNEPDYWKLILDKYDPDRVFSKKYENKLLEL